MKKAIILVTMMTFCLASGAVLAKKPAPAPVGPDWDAAFAFAKVIQTEVDENGVVWETYWDDAQELMWAQPQGAPRDLVLASLEAGGVPVDEEGFVVEETEMQAEALGGGGVQPMTICSYYPLFPHSAYLSDDGTGWSYTDDVSLGSCGTNCVEWTMTGYDSWNNINGKIMSLMTSSADYSSSYDNWYWDLDAVTPDWNNNVDVRSVSYSYLYRMEEDVDVDGNAAWDYVSTNTTWIAKHRYYACDAYRYVIMGYRRLI